MHFSGTLAIPLRDAFLVEILADEGDHLVEPGCRMQGGEHLLTLRLVRQRLLGEQLLKLRRFRGALPVDDDRD